MERVGKGRVGEMVEGGKRKCSDGRRRAVEERGASVGRGSMEMGSLEGKMRGSIWRMGWSGNTNIERINRKHCTRTRRMDESIDREEQKPVGQWNEERREIEMVEDKVDG